MGSRMFSGSCVSLSNAEMMKKIKQLRMQTSAPVMDCKEALAESNGDIEEAKKNLMKKGLTQMEKMQERVSSMGSLFVATNGMGSAAIVELNCQTDFVSSNDSFKNVLGLVANSLLANNQNGEWVAKKEGDNASFYHANIDWLKTLPSEGSDKINDALTQLNYSTGEKCEISKAGILLAPEAHIASYVHQGRISAIVSMNTAPQTDEQKEKVAKFGRNLAVHVGGFHPTAIGAIPGASETVVEEEYKDAEVLGEDVPQDLMTQPFSMVGGGSVGSNIVKFEKENGFPIKIGSFVRWEFGKEDETFACF